ncbi:MAG: DNA polymerase II large subunit [Euryarchaeota archaeon]|nr:DNA polymerase II large subunit [Euryarchaeota archaeon]
MRRYFAQLEEGAERCYAVARRARAKGLDPETTVEIPLAKDLAARVESLVGPPGIARRIREVTEAVGNREEAALGVAIEVAKMEGFRSPEEAMYQAVRTGLAILTEGVVVAPIEGIIGVKLKKNQDGTDFAAVYYAGPIRSAGGGAQALSVLLADIVRRELGIGRYVPFPSEIERYKEEIPMYKQAQHLQYTPSKDEIELIAANCPVCIDGEGTEEVEVQGFRDLPRVETNRLRGGACLVIAEGLCLKAPKIQKHVKRMGITGWEFVDRYLARSKPAEAGKQAVTQVGPSEKYIKDLIAGRPVFSHPSRKGGFRLRYGRSRTAGLAALSIHPATMFALDEFLSVGTQMKVERPGKASAMTPCDSIDGPTLLLNNGDLVQVNDSRTAQAVRKDVRRIIDLGEILVPYGEFAENNHVLLEGGYSWEWYSQELALALPPDENVESYIEPTPEEAFRLSERFAVPLHPRYNLFWHDLSAGEILRLREHLAAAGSLEQGRLRLGKDPQVKELLVTLGALHMEREDLLFGELSLPLVRCLGLRPEGTRLVPREGVPSGPADARDGADPVELVSRLAGFRVMRRSPTRIGGRMGRPEKARERRMKPPPHVIFPVGTAGGPQRLVNAAAEKGEVLVNAGMRRCATCGRKGLFPRCDCGGHTAPIEEPAGQRGQLHPLDVRAALQRAARELREGGLPDIKGVQGMMSRHRTPEMLEKGILRARHGVFVFKDGTARFDMTDTPVTHVRPSEISVDAGTMRQLGYDTDYTGRPLETPDQLVELRPQDIVVSRACGRYLLQVSQFVDDLLVRFYGLEPFYNAREPEDLIGHLVLGLAPHTSAGVLARIIGYTNALVGYAHPFFHAAKRRNCDGDEDCVMLLLDGLLDFSESFLPVKRGGRMDAPLVLSAVVEPSEIDKEALNLDVGNFYPLEFYRATMRNAPAKEVEGLMDTVGRRIGTPAQYEGFGFTHDTADIGEGPRESAYKTLGATARKMEAQFNLGQKLRAVDVPDMAARVIETHLLPDITGNLKKFSKQITRCPKCGSKFRRVPLKGACTRCGGRLILTVHEKSVKKYIDISKKLAERYGVKEYTRQRVAIMEQAVDSLFENGRMRRSRLEEFMGDPSAGGAPGALGK